MLYLVIALGCLIIAGLGFYAGKLLYQLKQQNERQAKTVQQRLEHLIDSIQTIAFAMHSGQCDYSEGSIRLAVLLENVEQIETSTNFEQAYPNVFQLYHKIKHMPTHDARKQFSKKDIRAFDKQRLAFEAEHTAGITTELEKLKVFSL